LSLSKFIIFLFAIEFLDELICGLVNAAWPLIRQDLSLNYIQVGIILSLPSIVGNCIEPFLGILSETGHRRFIVLAGGVAFALALFLTSVSPGFAILLTSFILFYPASGAFVSLSQATLMDLEPDKREVNMAKWTFCGSAGVVGGPLLLSGFLCVNGTWRHAFIILAIASAIILSFVWRFPYEKSHRERLSFGSGFKTAIQCLFKKTVLRWLILLEFSDLMLDVLMAYLALYFVDVVGQNPGYAALAVAIWSTVGLLGDLLIIPFLKKVMGLVYLRWSAFIELILYPIFLLFPWFWAKLIVLGLLGFFNAGWYSILKARLYSTMPERSGLILTVNNISGIAGAVIPFAVGVAAQYFGLSFSMWLLLLGPMALLIGIPFEKREID